MSPVQPEGYSAAAAPPDELSLVDVVTPLVRRWRLLVLAPLVAALLTLAAVAVWPPQYSARLVFTPEKSSGGGLLDKALGGLGVLGSIAGASGLAGSLSEGPSPDFYAGVLTSRELLEATLASRFARPEGGSDTATLLELMRPRGSTPARRLGNARRKLAKRVTISVDRKAGMVTLAVSLHDARLSADVANRMVQLLERFNLERRQSSSREQRRFAERRLAVAQGELRRAEEAHTRFLLANRRYVGSPLLAAEGERLERDVRSRQEVVTGLMNAFEEARIAEVRDTPMITIIDRAAPPDRRSKPRPVLWTVTMTVTTLALTIAWALLSGFREREARRAEPRRDVRDLSDAVAEARAERRAVASRP